MRLTARLFLLLFLLIALTSCNKQAAVVSASDTVPVVPVVLEAGKEARYPATTGGEFLQSRLDPTYSHMAGKA